MLFQDNYLNRLKWTTMVQDDDNWSVGLDVLEELLRRSGLFIRSPDELSLWLYCIRSHPDREVGALLAVSLKWALQNTSTIYKSLLRAQEESTSEHITDVDLDDLLKCKTNYKYYLAHFVVFFNMCQ